MTTEQIMTLMLLTVATVFMIILAVKDHSSFKRDQHVNYKSIIVSLGILGTFSGIILGLWHFNTQDIVASVPRLLEGLKLAFLTSVMGMGVSVVLSVLQAQPDKKSETDTIMPEIKQQLEKVNQTLVAKLDTTNRTLVAILEDVKQFKTTYQRYQREHRFTPLSADGQILPETATESVAIQDNETGLIWEVKTNDGGLQDGRHTYTWYDPEGDRLGKKNGGNCQGCRCDTAGYVKSINEKQLAGSNHWRVPTIAELDILFKAQSVVDKGYFPYLQPSAYCSATCHSSDKERFWCLDFKTGLQAYNKGYGHLMLVSTMD